MTFDHRDPGTDPERWTALLDSLTPGTVDLDGFAVVLVVAPHPDDETLGAGGLVATAAARGLPVEVVLVTRGERSHPDSPTVGPDDLAGRRDEEFRAALAALHPGAVGTSLRVPDGSLREHPDVLRTALDERLAEASGRVLLVAPWRGDGHRDHRVAGEVAEAVAAGRDDVSVLAYPVWAWHWDEPDTPAAPWDRARALALSSDALDRKRDALAAYPSQTRPLSPAPGDEAIVDERHAAHHLRTTEWFFPVDTVASLHSSSRSRSQESFDDHYARKPEGWDFDGSWYERRKRAVTLAALPRERYRSALELGCATGVLTAAITGRADRVLGTDISEAPLARARERAPGARFVRAALPEEWPEGRFDLVVFSEIGYYLSPADLDRTIDRITGALDDDGVLVACHWRHPDDEAVTDGDTVDARLAERWPRPALVRHVEEDFVLSVFPGPSVSSVARAEGLVR